MPELTCPDPRFEWLGEAWSPCVECGRLAWDHEQADPTADIRTVMREAADAKPWQHPPVMRKVAPDVGA
jgi:hypothetical protein